jgi:acetolactate synthase-1/3 small subunit
MKKKYLLALLAENKPGVLAHICGLVNRRGFNIESITAGDTEEPNTSRIHLVVKVESEEELEQAVNQLKKLIDVVKVVNTTSLDSIKRELALIKVRASKENRTDIIHIVEIFRAKIVDVNPRDIVVELSAEQKKLEALIDLLQEFGIIEIVRTGAIAITRGPVPVKEL